MKGCQVFLTKGCHLFLSKGCHYFLLIFLKAKVKNYVG